MKLLALFVLAAALSVGPVSCAHRSRALYQPGPISVYSQKTNPKSAVRKALLDYGWIIEKDAPGAITARQLRGTHEARVKIAYDPKKVTIRYVDSKDLNYKNEGGVETIHTRYNSWVQNLERRIATLTAAG